MPLRLLTAFACLVAALALTPVAPASLTMYMGAAEDEGRNADPLVAAAKLELARAAGLEAIRITAIWTPGLSELPLDQLEALRSIAAAGDFNGIKIVVTVMPYGSSVTPLTATARRDFASFPADVRARRLGLAARTGRRDRGAAHAFPHGVHRGHGRRLPRQRPAGADHGRLRVPSLRGELEHAARLPAPSLDVDRPR